MGSDKNQRLTFRFSNSGVLETYTRDPGLIAELSSNSGNPPPAFYSSQIVHTSGLGFELVADTQSEPPQWITHLQSNLGMPSNASLRHITTTGAIFGIRWQQYYLRFLGMLIDQAEHSECSWPFWRISDNDGNDVELVQVWYQRVSCMTSPVYCDVRWQPNRGETVTFPNIENARRVRDITVAWRGQLLLKKINPLGRPANSEAITETQFIERAPLACAKLLNEFGETPTDVQIAEELQISRATFYRYMERDGLTLNEIRDKAVRLLIEPTNAPF